MAKHDPYKDLTLTLVRQMDGWAYEWQDPHGAVRCCGWSRGTKAEAEAEANAHLREARLPPRNALR